MSFVNELKGLVKLGNKVLTINFKVNNVSNENVFDKISYLIPRLSLSQFLHTHGQIPLSVKVDISIKFKPELAFKIN